MPFARNSARILTGCALLLPAAAASARPPSCADGRPTARVAWRAQPLGTLRPLHEPPAGDAPAASAARRAAARETIDPALNPWLLVLGLARADDGECWVRLRLPARPNDASGWVPARQVRLAPTPWRIAISRAERTLTLLHDGRPRTTARVVIGAAATPTPGGLFAVEGAWRNDPREFSGAWIVALTAHSRALRRFDGGEGRVAIHGRGGASLRDPLGSARSHGCVRVANDDLDRLVRTVGRWRLVGVPVRVR